MKSKILMQGVQFASRGKFNVPVEVDLMATTLPRYVYDDAAIYVRLKT